MRLSTDGGQSRGARWGRARGADGGGPGARLSAGRVGGVGVHPEDGGSISNDVKDFEIIVKS